MSKRIKNAVLAAALASVVAISGAASACTVKTSHPRAKITISFNEKTYDLEYTLYRNMYPQTVQHFIELADAGFYNDTIIHDYRSNDWIGGGYGYESSQYTENSKSEYLEDNSKENAYYDLFKGGVLSPSVYKQITYDKNGKEVVSPDDALATLIGEFSENDHKIENGALTASYGTLKMFYYDKGDSNQQVTLENSFGQILVHDYKYNCATSLFSIQVNNSSSFSVSKYCVFAQLKDDKAKGVLDDLRDAISDYISDELGGSTSKFTSTVNTKVDNEDTFAEDGGREIETSFTMTSMPIIIKTVSITKY